MVAPACSADSPPGGPTALCMGDLSEELFALLSDVLAEARIRVCKVLPASEGASLILVGLGNKEVKRTMTTARSAAGVLPIVAVLPFQDRRLVVAALQAGADACYALGTPLLHLRVVVAQLLISRWTNTPCAFPHLRRSP